MYIRHCTNSPHTHPSRLQSTRTTGLPFTLKRSSILSPHLCPSIPVCPGTPAVLVACCAYFPASWLCIQMAVGMNDGRYRFALLPGMLNVLILLVCLLSNSGLSGWVSPAQNCAYFVCDYSQWWAVPMLSGLCPTTLPTSSTFSSSLFLPWLKITVQNIYVCKISSRTSEDPSY